MKSSLLLTAIAGLTVALPTNMTKIMETYTNTTTTPQATDADQPLTELELAAANMSTTTDTDTNATVDFLSIHDGFRGGLDMPHHTWTDDWRAKGKCNFEGICCCSMLAIFRTDHLEKCCRKGCPGNATN